MRLFGVVMDELGTEGGAKRFIVVAERLAKLHRKSLVEQGAVEALDDVVGLWRAETLALRTRAWRACEGA
jgi:hypothetical protein